MPNRVEQVAIPAPVAELVAAWNDRSADRFVAIMAPDVHVEIPPLHLEMNGRDDVWMGVARVFASFGALRYSYRHRYLTPDTVTDEALLEGLQTHEFLGAPPIGRPGGVAARVMMEHDGVVITRLEVWPDIAALRDLSDGVARRIDLRSAGPAAPIVAELRATIPATERKLSVAQERQPLVPVVDATPLPEVAEGHPGSGGAGGGGHSDVVEHSKGRPKAEVPKAPVPRKIRRLRGVLAGLVMLVVAGLLVTYVVTGVRNKSALDAAAASKPRPTAQPTGSTSAKSRPKASASAAPKGSGTTPAPTPTLNPVTNTYSFTNKVLFERNKYALRSQAREQLDQVIKALKEQKRFGLILVTGYTDDTGTAAYNLVLSRQRARVVEQYLTANLNDSRFPVSSRGLGATGFVADNSTDAGRELNRRVEIKVPDPTTG